MKHDYRFEIQEDKLGICFSVITTDEVDAVTRANEALRQIHDMPDPGFDIPLDFAGIVRARLYLADVSTEALQVTAENIVDFTDVEDQ